MSKKTMSILKSIVIVLFAGVLMANAIEEEKTLLAVIWFLNVISWSANVFYELKNV